VVQAVDKITAAAVVLVVLDQQLQQLAVEVLLNLHCHLQVALLTQ
jgi:hypothetical protein